MTALRQDAWSEEEDLILAEVVLKNIREGQTQLNAFEEVGRRLERTAAACGFRWNAAIRKRYEEAVKIAKQQKKKEAEKRTSKDVVQKDEFITSDDRTKGESTINLSDVITYLKGLEAEENDPEALKETLDKEQEKNRALSSKVETLQQELESVRNDYRSFLSLLDKARSWQGEKES